MSGTEKIIDDLNTKVLNIDSQITKYRNDLLNGVVKTQRENDALNGKIRELIAKAGETEKDIKKFLHLDEMSGNVLHETIALHNVMLNNINDYCHVEDEVTEIQTLIELKKEMYEAELERRYKDDESN